MTLHKYKAGVILKQLQSLSTKRRQSWNSKQYSKREQEMVRKKERKKKKTFFLR